MKSFLLSSRRCLAVLAAPLCQKRDAIHPAAKPAGRLHEKLPAIFAPVFGGFGSALVPKAGCHPSRSQTRGEVA